jgi:hypothetical protein
MSETVGNTKINDAVTEIGHIAYVTAVGFKICCAGFLHADADIRYPKEFHLAYRNKI